tara:strand:- start:551 stop:844 length:294 start_codon:yes stop_codon:yes gene_type:complete
MGKMKELAIYFDNMEAEKAAEYQKFLTCALLYVNNVNGTEVFEATYNRPYDDDDGYSHYKVNDMQKSFDSWFLYLDSTNRRNFIHAVMQYMAGGRNA